MISRQECLARLRRDAHPISPGQKFTVKDFDPDDAKGIASLYYAVYGDTFPVDQVYDPEQIILANSKRDAHHIVGRTESGEIVGLYALFRNAPGKDIMEVGSWIVHPAYRNTTLAMRLARSVHEKPPEQLGLNAIYGQSVCDQLVTQKMVAKYKSVPCALEVEAMPARPSQTEETSAGRISLLDGFLIIRDVAHAVHLPAAYADTLRRLYLNLGASRQFVDDSEPGPRTSCSVQFMDKASLVKMTIDAPGLDVAERLAGLETDYPGGHVAQIVIPLWRPGVSLAVDAARKAGYFLGGLLPLWADRDALLLQKLRSAPEYSRILLYSQEAKTLLQEIIADRDAVTSGL
jgi:predicted GNAT family N-acyltransferase